MITADHTKEEARRAALSRYQILDTLPEVEYDAITRLAAQICGARQATIGLFDTDRLWFKSCHGLNVCEVPRETSICASLAPYEVLVVPDLSLDERFCDYALVVGAPHLRFYAGTMLMSPEGYCLGSLCVLDAAPRQLTTDQCEALRSLGQLVVTQLELRLSARRQSEAIAEQRKAEEESKRGMAHIDDVLGAISSILIAVNELGTVTDWNQAAERTFGITAEQALGRSLTSSPVSWDWERVGAAIAQCLSERRSVLLDDVAYTAPDGEKRLLGLRINTIATRQGQCGFLLQAADITERRQSERERQEISSRNSLLLECAGEGIYGLDAEGSCIFINPAAAALLGYPSEEAMGRPLHKLICPSATFQSRTLGGGEVCRSERELFRRKDGAEFPVSYSCSPILDHGAIRGCVVHFQDITDKIAVEKELRESRERYEFALAGSQSGFWEVDLRSYKPLISPGYKRMLGYAEDEITDEEIWPGSVHPDDIASVLSARRAYLERSIPSFKAEFRLLHRDGSYRWVESNATALWDENGIPVRFAGSMIDITQNKQFQIGLQRSFSILKAQQDGMLDAVLIISEDRKIVSYNQRFCSYFKLDIQAVRDLESFGTLKHVASMMGDAQAFVARCEYLYAHPDESSYDELALLDGRVMERSSHPIVADDGAYYGRVWYFRDITERRSAEFALRQRTELLSNILATTPDLVFWKDVNSVYQGCNANFTQAFGFSSSEDVVGLTDWDIPYIQRHAAIYIAHDREVIETGQPIINLEETVTHEEAGALTFLTNKIPLRDKAGKIIGILVVCHDITERLKVEEALRESNQRLGALIASSPLAIYTVDRDGIIQSWNAAAAQLYGWTELEMVGRSFSTIHVAGGEKVSIFRMVLDSAKYFTDVEEVRLRRDGTLVDVSVSAAPLRDADGAVTGVIAMAADISSRKLEQAIIARNAGELAKAADELERRNWELAEARDAALAAARLKSEFLANTSHEIRTPMNGVLGMLTLLEGTPLGLDQENFVRTIRVSADSLLTIIEDILDFSKIEAGKMTVEQAPFQLHQVIEDVADLLAQKAGEKNLRLICDIPPLVEIAPAISLLGDAGRLRQVLVNLVGNALKFTPDGGQVMIRAELLHQDTACACWRIEVIDTGIGIPLDRQKLIFESFTQSDGSTTRKYGGTGLGLTISRQLVELMGGCLAVTSEPGQGSVFSLELTLEKAPFACLPQLHPNAAVQRALVLIGCQTQRETLCRWLKAWGIEPVDADAKGHAPGDAPVDVVIVDADLYDMTLPQQPRLAMPGKAPATCILLDRFGSTFTPSTPTDACVYAPVRQLKLAEAIDAVLAPQNAVSQPVVDERQAGDAPMERGKRVLIAEDNPVNQMVLAGMLGKLGVRREDVTTVESGVDAVQRATSEAFAMIFMDVLMPGMDGLAASRSIRAYESASGTSVRTPIVALTGLAHAFNRESCLSSGMDDYISKPIHMLDLTKVFTRFFPQSNYEILKSEPHAASDSDALDRNQLEAASGGDPEMAKRLIEEFCRSGEKMLMRCGLMLELGDATGLEHWAHTLKGSSWTVGATVLGNTMQQLEALGKSGSLSNAEALMACAEEEWTRLKAAFQTL